ncbi:hypothetical protein Cgig2_029029 [Carnegiea gigantea]|uniref:Aminotransferase class I/classII large domain-containing protein n=1 Tax=Carnegiea gigantea TaxID=171969 RepID=A0A9Q1JUS7_9CARY|nr:hypothetical protein Cgig2_029029 [Carnegiea gigantea]
MEDGDMKKWRSKLGKNEETTNGGVASRGVTVREVRTLLMANLNPNDEREFLPLAHGDPSIFPSFCTSPVAVDAVLDAFRSGRFNCYAPAVGLLPARKAVAEHLSHDLPYKLSTDDVFITIGCTQAIDITLSALNRPTANVLLPRPGYPYYEARSSYIGLETRYFDLLPEREWEVDLHALETLTDSNTIAMVIINPGNPCGNVYSYHHLQKVAEMAKKLGLIVISDEVYGHLTLGSKPFVPMGVFGSIAPVITVGSISKRWLVPGWRLGWLVINDTHAILHNLGVQKQFQGALPQILEKTKGDFFLRIKEILQYDADICYEKLKNIPGISCPHKPEGAMFIMVKLNLTLLDDILDDIDFCIKLAKEENMIVLPGVTVGLKNWLRITYALEPSALQEGLARIQAFCQRHAATN